MKIKSVLFGAILGAFAGHAHSADIATENQIQFEPIDNYTFSGPYIGVGVCGNMLNNEINIDILTVDGIGAGTGVCGEAYVGLQHEFQNGWLLGLEVGGTLDNAETTLALSGIGSIEASRDYTIYAGVKAGRTITEQALLYVMPFYRWTTMDVDISFGGGGASFSQDYEGIGAQLGLDVLATENIVLGLYGRGTWYDGENWGVTGLDVETRELEAGVRVAFKSNPLFGN